jgi:hypothetical protein
MELLLKQIADNITMIILRPKEFWAGQKHGNRKQYKLLGSYFIPLIVCVGIAVFIGVFSGSGYFYAGFALLKSLREIVLFMLFYLISVFFINELMKIFGGEKNMQIARKLIIFSLTPFLLVSIITGLFPFLYVLDVLGLYGFFIFWTGASELVTLPGKNMHKFILINILACFSVFSILSILLSKLLTLYF